MIQRIAIFTVLVATQLAAQAAFDVASIKPSKPGGQPNSNVPMGPGDWYSPTGGLFTATNQPLFLYVAFAYKLGGNQLQNLRPQLPDWATRDFYDIQARASGNPGKDDFRMMMRALLADRFKLALHYESREVPVLAMILVKPGVPGPQLFPHPADAKCSTHFDDDKGPLHTAAGDLPGLCNGVAQMPASERGRLRFAGRNVTIGFIGDSLSAGAGLGRPIMDRTGLTGTFDFILEHTPQPPGAQPPSPDAEPPLDFQDAMRSQLGIKLVSQKGPVSMMIVDHVERPSAN